MHDTVPPAPPTAPTVDSLAAALARVLAELEAVARQHDIDWAAIAPTDGASSAPTHAAEAQLRAAIDRALAALPPAHRHGLAARLRALVGALDEGGGADVGERAHEAPPHEASPRERRDAQLDGAHGGAHDGAHDGVHDESAPRFRPTLRLS